MDGYRILSGSGEREGKWGGGGLRDEKVEGERHA